MFTMTTIALRAQNGWVLISNFRNPSFSGSTSKIQLFKTQCQNIELNPEGNLSIFIRNIFIGATSVEIVQFEGDDKAHGAIQCALTAWSFAQHNTVRRDCFEDDDFLRDFRFFQNHTRPGKDFFVPGVQYLAKKIVHILTEEEVEQMRTIPREQNTNKVFVMHILMHIYLCIYIYLNTYVMDKNIRE